MTILRNKEYDFIFLCLFTQAGYLEYWAVPESSLLLQPTGRRAHDMSLVVVWLDVSGYVDQKALNQNQCRKRASGLFQACMQLESEGKNKKHYICTELSNLAMRTQRNLLRVPMTTGGYWESSEGLPSHSNSKDNFMCLAVELCSLCVTKVSGIS